PPRRPSELEHHGARALGGGGAVRHARAHEARRRRARRAPQRLPEPAPRRRRGRGPHAAPRPAGSARAPAGAVPARVAVAQFFAIHPVDPQRRLVRQVAEIVRGGGLIAYPTDSCYALGCRLGDPDAVERLRRLRGFGPKHHLTLMCRDLSEIARYAIIEDTHFR